VNVSDPWRPTEYPSRDERGTAMHAITVRRFIVIAFSAGMTTFVWRYTGGDPVLSIAAFPVFHGFISYWLVDDSDGHRRTKIQG
jgi:hypothetical protein